MLLRNASLFTAPLAALNGYASASMAPFSEVRAGVSAYGAALRGNGLSDSPVRNLLGVMDLVPIRPSEAPTVAQAAVAGLRAEGAFPLPSQTVDEFFAGLEGDFASLPYDLHGVLGRGCFSEVFHASDAAKPAEVAVKAYRPPFRQNEEGGVPLRGLFNELRFQAASSLDCVVRALRCGLTLGAEPFLVLEYMPEGTIEGLIRGLSQGNPPSFEMLFSLAEFVLETAALVHQADIVHGDMTAANFLLGKKSRQAKLCDFALARRVSEPPYHFETFGKKDRKSEGLQYDVFQLGKILYQIFTVHPGDISDYNVMRAPTPSRKRPDLDLPPWIDEIVALCLHSELSVRYPDATAILEAFRRNL